MTEIKFYGHKIPTTCPGPPVCHSYDCRAEHFKWSEYCEIEKCSLLAFAIAYTGISGKHRRHDPIEFTVDEGDT